MVSHLSRPQFSDKIIKATALNRRSGAILDKASKGPITINRNDEYFALLNRDLLADLMAEATYAGKVFDLVQAALQVLSSDSLTLESPYGWLSAFDADEIKDLITEVLGAFRKAHIIDNGWEELEAILYEWQESAIALLSEDLEAAFSDDSDEVLLTAPG